MLNFKFTKPKCGIINTRSAGLQVIAAEVTNSAWNSLFMLISSSGYNFKTVTYNCWMF